MVAKEAVSWAVAAGDGSEPSFTYIGHCPFVQSLNLNPGGHTGPEIPQWPWVWMRTSLASPHQRSVRVQWVCVDLRTRLLTRYADYTWKDDLSEREAPEVGKVITKTLQSFLVLLLGTWSLLLDGLFSSKQRLWSCSFVLYFKLGYALFSLIYILFTVYYFIIIKLFTHETGSFI